MGVSESPIHHHMRVWYSLKALCIVSLLFPLSLYKSFVRFLLCGTGLCWVLYVEASDDVLSGYGSMCIQLTY